MITKEHIPENPRVSLPVEEAIEPQYPRPETEIDVASIVRTLLAEKKTILRFAGACALATLVVVMVMKPYYRAQATFLPPNSMASGPSAILGQMASLSSAGGVLGSFKDPAQQYIGLLGSRSVADDIIKRFDLVTVYQKKLLSQAEASLKKNTDIVVGKDTIIILSFYDKDPQRAAAIANAYLGALGSLSDRVAVTEAGQRRQYFEKHLAIEKDALANAEVDLAQMQEKNSIIQPDSQARLQIETIAQLQAQISSLEVELASLGQGATDQNPEVIRLRAQIAGLRNQIARLERSKADSSPSSVMVPTGKVPELSMLYIRKARDVKYHQALYELLMRQFEAARLEESRSAPMVQIIDHAVIPDRKYGPQRALWTLGAAIVGFVLGIMWILLKQIRQTYLSSIQQKNH